MTPLDLVRLTPLLNLTSGKPEVIIGLLDGPVAMNHPELASDHIRQARGRNSGACSQPKSIACLHGTFVAGVFSAKRDSIAPAICPNCTLLVRPIFHEITGTAGELPSATPEEFAQAIVDCIEAGARVVNVSGALSQSSIKQERAIEEVLEHAAKRGVIVVVAAGDQGRIGSTAITRHTSVIPVVAFDLESRPIAHSNLGISIGRRGLGAPGDRITSLGTDDKPLTLGGTSAAAPFVSAAIALLWSEFPKIGATDLRFAIMQPELKRRASVVPPLLDAWASYQFLLKANASTKLL